MQAFLTSWFEHQLVNVSNEALPSRWQSLRKQALAGELEHWQQSPPGMLGLILLFTQMPLKLGDSPSERHHNKARALCLAGIRRGFDTQLRLEERRYFYAPLFDSDDDEDRQLLERLLRGMRAQAADSDPERCRLRDWHSWWQHAQLQSIAGCKSND